MEVLGGRKPGDAKGKGKGAAGAAAGKTDGSGGTGEVALNLDGSKNKPGRGLAEGNRVHPAAMQLSQVIRKTATAAGGAAEEWGAVSLMEEGEMIGIKFRGYLFFGSVLEIQGPVSEAILNSGARIVVLDFNDLIGLDASACICLATMNNQLIASRQVERILISLDCQHHHHSHDAVAHKLKVTLGNLYAAVLEHAIEAQGKYGVSAPSCDDFVRDVSLVEFLIRIRF